jgi:hypothetical protein
MITAATALALVVAVFALIALPGNDSGSDVPRDAYTVSADRICTNAKKQIGNASNRALNREPNGAEQYARALVPLVVQWRVDFDALKPPPDRLGRAAALDAALRQVEVQAASVALAAQSHVPDLLARARELDRRTQDVEGAIRDLGLTDCENVVIAPGAPAPG